MRTTFPFKIEESPGFCTKSGATSGQASEVPRYHQAPGAHGQSLCSLKKFRLLPPFLRRGRQTPRPYAHVQILAVSFGKSVFKTNQKRKWHPPYAATTQILVGF
jgi:hypothetical protein